MERCCETLSVKLIYAMYLYETECINNKILVFLRREKRVCAVVEKTCKNGGQDKENL